MKQVCQRGIIKITDGQRKKHYTNITNKEFFNILNRLSFMNLDKIDLSYHLQNKISKGEINLNYKKIKDALSSKSIKNNIIEYNEVVKNGKITDKRVLIRDKDNSYNVKYINKDGTKINKKSHLCLVVSLKSFRVITAYWNAIDDNHDTLIENQYSDFKILI